MGNFKNIFPRSAGVLSPDHGFWILFTDMSGGHWEKRGEGFVLSHKYHISSFSIHLNTVWANSTKTWKSQLQAKDTNSKFHLTVSLFSSNFLYRQVYVVVVGITS